VYLSRAAAVAVFRFVGTLPAGSEIAFTFAPHERSGVLASHVEALGEPFRTTFEAHELPPLLAPLGFGRVELLTEEAAHGYLGRRRDALRLPPRLSVASAVVEAFPGA
jgi:hypothetical protein